MVMSRYEARKYLEAAAKHPTPSDHADAVLRAICEWAIVVDELLMELEKRIAKP